MDNLKPPEIKQARLNARLTQEAAAKIVHSDIRTWRRWENGERNMPPAAWELFGLKTGQITLAQVLGAVDK